MHLDINYQFEVLDLVKRLSKEEGLTVVIVSHDLPMVVRYCDRVVLIHDHKVFADGTPDAVLTRENMKTVFNIDAVLEYDSTLGGEEREDVRLVCEAGLTSIDLCSFTMWAGILWRHRSVTFILFLNIQIADCTWLGRVERS